VNIMYLSNVQEFVNAILFECIEMMNVFRIWWLPEIQPLLF